MNDNIQVEPDHYDFSYDSKKRFMSYWHQINEIMKLEPENLLEIGVGSNFLANYLRNKIVDIKTVDIDGRLNPDIVGNILNLPFKDDSFEVVTAFEVLEHLPFSYFKTALKELKRVSRSHVIISLPDKSKYIRIYVKFPHFWSFKKLIDFNGRFLKENNLQEFDEHKWEIGIENYPLKKITKKMNEVGFTLKRTQRIYEIPYHRFFVLVSNG